MAQGAPRQLLVSNLADKFLKLGERLKPEFEVLDVAFEDLTDEVLMDYGPMVKLYAAGTPVDSV